jgi:hypothetical protein
MLPLLNPPPKGGLLALHRLIFHSFTKGLIMRKFTPCKIKKGVLYKEYCNKKAIADAMARLLYS